MKVGYVSTNYSLCKADSTIRLSSLSRDAVLKTSISNLECLKRTLLWNLDHEILFFRISSKTIPFASHPKATFDWRDELSSLLGEVGEVIRENGIRVSMHPGQYVVINSQKRDVVESSIAELRYHADLLDAMGVEGRIQIHVGSSSGGKEEALKRFEVNFQSLPDKVKRRMAIENDDRIFTVKDCLRLYQTLKVPVILDNLHQSLNNDGETFSEALEMVRKTWKERPMIDYSTQQGSKRGVHASTLDVDHFREFVKSVDEVDIMLEIKDKEKSALKAVEVLKEIGKLDRVRTSA